MSEPSPTSRFPTTCWSRIVAAGDPAAPAARAALEGLCRDYWFPLYAFVRHRGHPPDAAEDLVQGFLADLLERVLARLDAEATAAGKADLFARLRPALQGDELAPSYQEIATALGMSSGAVRVAAHRLRACYHKQSLPSP
jgi:DNA-directed RNA polymerase specialized sigma24 family protein